MRGSSNHIFLAALGSILLLAQAGFAADGIAIGTSTLKTDVMVEEKFDSNVFLTPSDRKSDYINVIAPKFDLTTPFGMKERHKARVIYFPEIGTYSDYKQENYVNHNVKGDVKFELPSGYFLIKDFFRETVDKSSTDLTQQVRRTENKGDVVLGLEMNKLSYDLGYGNFDTNYKSSDYANLEYNENSGIGTAYYAISPKTKSLVEYKYGVLDYRNDSTKDGSYHQVQAGLKGDLTGKTEGTVKAGYQNRDYDQESKKGFSGLTVEAGLLTKFTQRTELLCKFNRMPTEATSGTGNYYLSNRVSAELSQKLWEKFKGLLSCQYEHNAYSQADTSYNKKRKDNLVTTGLGLEYIIKDWVKAKASYEYKEDISNVDTKDYNRNLTSLSVTFSM